MIFNICVIQPKNYVHSAAFTELAELVTCGLADLGHVARCNTNQIHRDATNVLIGVHLLPTRELEQMPDDTIVLNTEQIHADDSSWRATILSFASRLRVWDYSDRNIAFLRSRGIDHVRKLPIGYHPRLRRIPRAPVQDIDVLFYGSVGERRQIALQRLQAAGLKVKAVFGVYGAERDALIARSRVVLNLHHYQSRIFEIVRVFYLMTNGKAVVAEVDADTSIDAEYRPGVRCAGYDELTAACLELARDDGLRAALEHRAYETIRVLPQAERMARMLDQP